MIRLILLLMKIVLYLLYRVQETDNFFLESYSALSWNIHNRQLMAGQDLSQEEPPPSEASVGIKPPPNYRITSLEVSKHLTLECIQYFYRFLSCAFFFFFCSILLKVNDLQYSYLLKQVYLF